MHFTELWTLKEAYLKALGSGLQEALDEFRFEFRSGSKLHFNGPPGAAGESWRFGIFAPSHNHRIAVAVRAHSSTEIRVRSWSHKDPESHLTPLQISP